MRILHVHSGNLYGGVETFLATLARCRALCPAMEPEYALCFDGRLAAELRQARVPLHSLGEVRARYPLTVMRARRRLRGLLRDARFDAVVCHMPWPQAIFGPVVRSADIPLIFWMHDASSGRHWLERWARLTRPDLVLCNSAYTASTLRRAYPRTPHQMLHYPVAPSAAPNPADRAALRAELDTPADALVIVQASRMEAWKGHPLLLDALGGLRDVPRWICWIAGGAQRPHERRYLKSLREMVAALGISDRLRFLGQRSDVASILTAADIYCQPNLGPEPFGIVFVEALLAGLPVVTTTLGGAQEIVDRSCGFTVAPKDARALAGALSELIRNPADRERLGAAGPSRAAALCDPAMQLDRLHAIVIAAVDFHDNPNTVAAKAAAWSR